MNEYKEAWLEELMYYASGVLTRDDPDVVNTTDSGVAYDWFPSDGNRCNCRIFTSVGRRAITNRRCHWRISPWGHWTYLYLTA